MAELNENGVFGGVQFENELQQGGNNEINNVTESQNGGIFDNILNENAESGNGFGFGEENAINFEPIPQEKAVAPRGLWSKVKAFLFQEIDLNAPIKLELTPYQQKVEDEINEFLHQEITFKGIVNFFKGKK